MTTKLLLCLMLLGSSLPAFAAGDAQLSASAGTECTVVQDEDEATVTRSTDKPAAQPAGKSKQVRRGGSDTDATSRTPRWHSFLPGMFR